MNYLNIDVIRSHFPSLSNEYTFFDNAGGSQTVKQVGNKIQDYLINTNVQLGASYEISKLAGERVKSSEKLWSEAINAESSSEIVLGSSTTALLQNLSRSLVQQFSKGDEIIVSNSDHEANIGPWIAMEKHGLKVIFWNINKDTLRLELDDLEKLITDKTKLVAFTHVSNILGTINPIEEITEFIHNRGALVCVDGVAYAPHRLVDVRKWNVDFYVFSFYKVYGPHYSLLYINESKLRNLININHYFIDNDDYPYKLQPGNVNFELSYGSTGILDYFNDIYENHFNKEDLSLFQRLTEVFNLIASYEEKISLPLMDFLNNKSTVNIIGNKTNDKEIRVPTISFTIDGEKSSDIPKLVDPYKIGIRWGDFYARRLINSLNLSENDGVVRVSMVHYNSLDEVNKLIEVLDNIL